MTKLERFFLDNQCYHVISATKDRAPIFLDPACASILVNAVQFARRRRAHVLAYVVMPDHFHGLFVPQNGVTISQVMQSIKGFTARLINKKLDRRGPLWQRSFYDRMIRDTKQLVETVNYMHMNPVLAGLADNAEEYEYSSAGRQEDVDIDLFL